MARAYSNDLRRKLLEAHEQGKGTLEQLAEKFGVSLGYAKKISATLGRTGRMERIEQRHGRIGRVTPLVQERLRELLRRQPDLTLAELQRQLREQMQVTLSIRWLWVVLHRMKLRLKKNRSTPRSRTPRKTTSAAKRGGKR
jgi:transposase